MAEEHEPTQHREVLHAEDLRHRGVGGRHGGQPQEPDHRREHVHRDGGERREQEHGDRHRAGEIDEGQDVPARHALAQGAGDVGAEDVEEADQGQRVARHLGREAVVLEVAGHVHADEHHLEAAHEVPGREQQEAGVAQRFGQGLAHGLAARRGRSACGAASEARLAQSEGQRHDEQHHGREGEQRFLPAQAGDQLALHGHHQELAERAGSRGHAHGPGALLGRDLAAQHAIDHGVGGARLGRADQHAGREGEQQGRGRQRHACQPEGVEHRPCDQHAEGPEAVGRHAREDAEQAPGEVLHGERERECLAGPAHVLRDGLQPQAEAVADAHGERDDGRAAGQDLHHGELRGFGGHPSNVAKSVCRRSPRDAG